MGWEKRKNRYYFYQKKRIDGKVCSIYLGNNEIGYLFFQISKDKQILKELERSTKMLKDVRIETFNNEIADLYKLNKSLVAALYLANGYHQHKFQWRMKRNGKLS